MYALVERHLYIGLYLSSGHSIPTCRHYQSRKHIVARQTCTIAYQPNLLSYVCRVPSPASRANIAIVSVCWTVGWCAGVLGGNSIENDSILGNNGANRASIDASRSGRVCAFAIASSPSASSSSSRSAEPAVVCGRFAARIKRSVKKRARSFVADPLDNRAPTILLGAFFSSSRSTPIDLRSK